MAATKIIDAPRNGHEMAPLNTRARGDGTHGVTIVLTAPQRNSVQSVDIPGGDPERAAWSGKMQFFLSIIGYSVGLGNIWRFPYLCQQNGGGAFLIPFMIMLILEGIPLFLIELGMGQRMRLGALGVWNTIHPWLGGIGISSCIVTLFVALYYNVIITWVFFYLFNSFRYPLPWSTCPTNGTGFALEECAKSSETTYFWYRTTLDAAPSMDEPGGLKWWIVLCLMLSWTIVFFIVMKGIQSSGKVVYFTSLFPYIVLTIFFIRGITLRGAGAGLMHMYTPKVEKLLEPTVWLDAATQVFYSFGLAFGSLIAFGSYNTPKNNCVRDVLLVSVCNAVTAIYASVVIFAILGFKATMNVDRCVASNTDILVRHAFLENKNATTLEYEHAMDKLKDTEKTLFQMSECTLSKELDNAAEGTGLAFIVFTQAIVELPGKPFWAVLFFTMLLPTGTGLADRHLEGMIAVIFIYGHERFTEDIYQMTGYRPGLYWQLTWRYIGPVIMVCILASSIVFMVIRNPTYGAWNAELGVVEQKEYPRWVMGIALSMIMAGVLPMPIVFLMRSFQCLKVDLDIHQGSIRRNETTASTKEMIDNDDDEDDENDFSGPALGGHVKTQSDFSDDDEEDKPMTMRMMMMRPTTTSNVLNVPTSRKQQNYKKDAYDV
ncbi:GL17081 [Drosophila persimilis]|uniref:Transporter n=1 Tax=Drosophila persimilis TaxID=7234 RepID=B4GGS2_DROPE|nr:GL17081 [Drosophila persimilis]